jgi:hypothetical protein
MHIIGDFYVIGQIKRIKVKACCSDQGYLCANKQESQE